MSWITWVLILTGVGLNAAAQLLLKVATRPLAHFSEFSADTLGSSVAILWKSLPFWTGMVCYAASVCVWLAALSKAPVSTAYPMLSLGYVVNAIARRDLPAIQGSVLFLSVVFVLVNLITDIAYAKADPRVSYA